MRLYLNHVLTQANLNKLSKETQFSFSISAYDQANSQSIDLPNQLSFLLEPGFCVQDLTPSQSLKEQATKLLRAVPNATTMALFLNAIHQSLIVPTTLVTPDDPSFLNDTSVRYCFTLSSIVRDYLNTRKGSYGHQASLSQAINYLLKRKLSDPSTLPKPLYLPQEADYPPVHLTVTLQYTQFRALVEIANLYHIQSPHARNDTGLAGAAIEALVRQLI